MKRVWQGEVYWADLNSVKGHEQAGWRPVLIMQNDILNKNLHTVLIAPITTNLQAKGYFTTYFLSRSMSKLPKDSVVLLFQMRTLDKSRLKRSIGKLKDSIWLEVKQQAFMVF